MLFQHLSPVRASDYRRGREPPFYIVVHYNPVGVTECCVAPAGLIFMGISLPRGLTPPPMLCCPFGAYASLICSDTLYTLSEYVYYAHEKRVKVRIYMGGYNMITFILGSV